MSMHMRIIAWLCTCQVYAGRETFHREWTLPDKTQSRALATLLFGHIPAYRARQLRSVAARSGSVVMQEEQIEESKSEVVSEPPADPESEMSSGRERNAVDRLREQQQANSQVGAGFNQFDPVLSATNFISRRFGLAGGLAIVGLLAATEGKEILNAILTDAEKEGSGELVTTPSGLQYRDEKVSFSGSSPTKGNIVGIDLKISIGDKVLYDTAGSKKISFAYGERPFQDLICEGLEEGLKTMKPGGKRTLLIPKALAPAELKDLPESAILKYEVGLGEVLVNYLTGRS